MEASREDEAKQTAAAVLPSALALPFPRFVGPISDPPPLAIRNVASMKHSSSSSAFVAKLVGNVR
jgi:hypothetical protein